MLVYSTSKGLAAMTLALAHSRGWLDYDERVATYWPEFAQAGKRKVTVRQLWATRPACPVVDERLDPRILADFDRLAAAIAKQRPAWPPGKRHGYHGVSLGWYEGELMRRVDPEGRTLGRFFLRRSPRRSGSRSTSARPRTCRSERLARIERIPAVEGAAADARPPAPDGARDAEPALALVPDVRQPAAPPPGRPRPRRVPPARVPGGRRDRLGARHRARLRRARGRSARARHHGPRPWRRSRASRGRPPTAGTTRC